MGDREYKWAIGLKKYTADVVIILSCVSIINWAGEKVFKTSFLEDPSSSIINFIKMAASISASNMLLDYIDKKHII